MGKGRIVLLILAAVMIINGFRNIKDGWMFLILGAVIIFLVFKFPKKTKPTIRTNTSGENLDHLTPEGELPWGWEAYNKDIVQQMESELKPLRDAIYNATTPQSKCAALQNFIRHTEDGLQRYYSINECAGKFYEEYIWLSEERAKYMRQYNQLKKELYK